MSDEKGEKQEEPGERHGTKWRILAWTGERQKEFEVWTPELREPYVEKFPSALERDDPVVTARGTVFDELVISPWLHLEQMDDDHWWMSVGDARVDVHLRPDGKVDVLVERGQYGPIVGDTIVPGAPEQKG